MDQKDKYLFIELVLTFLLLISGVFLLKPALFWHYQLFLLGGLIAGFTFGWYNRKGMFEGIKYFVDLGILISVTWIVYRVFKSSFLYKEIIAILIQGVIILEIIFSFNFSAPGKIAYLKVLSLLIFMTSPVFAVIYSLPLAIVYLLIWLLILRFQFMGFSQPIPLKDPRHYYSLFVSLFCFLIAVLLAWSLSYNLYLGRIKKGGFFLDEDLQDMGGSGGGKESDQADNFYSLQDKLQEKITGLALKIDSYEKKRQLIYLFSELVKDSIKTMEADKAEIGLIDILKREGSGLEGASQAITFTRGYLDKKGFRNIQKSKEDIMEKLKKYPLGVFDRIKIISLANKVQQDNSYQKMQEDSQRLQEAIKETSLNKPAQRELGGLARSLSGLKSFEFYRSKIQDLDQRPTSFDEDTEKKIAEVTSDIKHTGGLDDLKLTDKKIRQLKNDSGISGKKSGKDLLEQMQEALQIKLDLFFTEKSEKVRKDAAQKQGSGSGADEFDENMDQAAKAKDHQEFIKEFSSLSQANKDNNLGLSADLSQILDLKTESFKQKEKDKLENLTSKELSSELKKEMLEAIESMEEKETLRELESQSKDLKERIEELKKEGDISPQGAAELLKAAEDFKELLDARLQAEKELKRQESSEKDSRNTDYKERLQKAIEDSSLSSQEKEALKALSEQLFKAENLSQLEEIKDVLEEEMSSLGKKLPDKDRMFLSTAAESMSVEMEKKIDNLENTTIEQIKRMQEALKKMQQSQDPQELEKNAQALKEAIESNTSQNKQEQSKMLEALQKLKETLLALLEKKSLSAKDLEKKINDLKEVASEKINQMQEELKKMQQSQDRRELEKNARELKESIETSVMEDLQNKQSDTRQDKQEQSKMLEELQKLKEALSALLEKKESSVQVLEKKIDNLENTTIEQINQMQEALKKMQQSRDARELEKNAQALKEAIESNTLQNKQEQSKMLEALQKLKETLSTLLEKRMPTAAESRQINNINEKIEQAAKIKQQFLMSQALIDTLEKVEELRTQDKKKAQELKEKLEQMNKSNAPEEVEKIITEIKNILNKQSTQETKESKGENGGEQQWKIYILSSPLVVSPERVLPLKVIAVYKNGYVKELDSDLEWFSANRQIAWVDDSNLLHSLSKGKTWIRAAYKGVATKNIEVSVVEDMDAQTEQMIKRELAQ